MKIKLDAFFINKEEKCKENPYRNMFFLLNLRNNSPLWRPVCSV